MTWENQGGSMWEEEPATPVPSASLNSGEEAEVRLMRQSCNSDQQGQGAGAGTPNGGSLQNAAARL